MIAVARATLIEQISAIVSGAWYVPCNGKDRRKLPMWGGRSRRSVGQSGSSRRVR
jgi:hypothetical protein